MIVIYKLFVIGGLNTHLINDLIPFLKKLWLSVETIVIAPPNLKEWESKKVFHPYPFNYKTDRYVLVKNDIMYIEFFPPINQLYNNNTFKMLHCDIDPIVYYLDYITVSVKFPNATIKPTKLYYNQKIFEGRFVNELVPFYYFHCNTQID
jgi:hypothetical protein